MSKHHAKWFAGFILVCCVMPSAASAKPLETEEARKLHEAMAGQRQQLAAIQDGFLTSNTQTVTENADKLALNMEAVSRTLPARTQDESEAWMAMYQIVAETQMLKEEAAKKNSEGAYEHYSKVIGQCVRCHQLSQVGGASGGRGE